ncbi:hypothetical protein IMG5_102980, partial [Ichthyophthirius multifiliis]
MQILKYQSFYFLNKLHVFQPENKLIINWKIFYIIMLIIQLIVVPFQISFGTIDQQVFYILPIIVFFIDIFIQINTGYYEDGAKQLDRNHILGNYKHQFLIDIIVITSYFIGYLISSCFMKMFIFLKLYQFQNLKQDIIQRYQVDQRCSHLYRLVSLLLMVVYVAHVCGCIFHLISMNEIQRGNLQTWLVDQQIQHDNNLIKYLNSLYFSIITMVTVGYGDIKPVAVLEKIFVIIMVLLGSLVFAYTVNTIGSIFQELAQKEADFNQKRYEMSVYMRSRQINIDIQVRVMKYMEYIKRQEDDNPIKGEQILNCLSNNLKNEIQKDFYGRILKSSKLFNLKFSNEFLLELSVYFKERVCGPGEIVYQQGCQEENDIYFVQKGTVELIIEYGKNQKQLFSVQQGKFFGEKEFFYGSIRENTAKCVKETHLLKLGYKNFISVLKEFPNDFEKFCQIKDFMQIYSICENISCISCGKYNHFITNCHLIHYKKSKEQFLARYTYSQECFERQQQQKKYRRKEFESLKQNYEVKFALKQTRIKYLDQKIDVYLTDKQFFKQAPRIIYENEEFKQEINNRKFITRQDDEEDEEILENQGEMLFQDETEENDDFISSNQTLLNNDNKIISDEIDINQEKLLKSSNINNNYIAEDTNSEQKNKKGYKKQQNISFIQMIKKKQSLSQLNSINSLPIFSKKDTKIQSPICNQKLQESNENISLHLINEEDDSQEKKDENILQNIEFEKVSLKSVDFESFPNIVNKKIKQKSLKTIENSLVLKYKKQQQKTEKNIDNSLIERTLSQKQQNFYNQIELLKQHSYNKLNARRNYKLQNSIFQIEDNNNLNNDKYNIIQKQNINPQIKQILKDNKDQIKQQSRSMTNQMIE